MIILSPDDAYNVDRKTFEREAHVHFGANAEVYATDDSSVSDAAVFIDRPDGSPFHVWHSLKCDSIWTDGGNKSQITDVAIWARSLVPDDPGGRVWLVDPDMDARVELVPRMTADDVWTGWAEIIDDEAS